MYSSKRYFITWAYTGAHSFLLIRSPMLYEDADNYSPDDYLTTDIEFYSVFYMELPDTFHGISIKLITENKPAIFDRFTYVNNLLTFEITEGGRIFYILASGLTIGTNSWTTRNRVSDTSLKHDNILIKI